MFLFVAANSVLALLLLLLLLAGIIVAVVGIVLHVLLAFSSSTSCCLFFFLFCLLLPCPLAVHVLSIRIHIEIDISIYIYMQISLHIYTALSSMYLRIIYLSTYLSISTYIYMNISRNNLNEVSGWEETFDFLQHFMRAGSALVNPLLQHFAQVLGVLNGELKRVTLLLGEYIDIYTHVDRQISNKVCIMGSHKTPPHKRTPRLTDLCSNGCSQRMRDIRLLQHISSY